MRKLSLKKETLVELTSTELAEVVGAAATLSACVVTGGSINCSYDDGCLTARGCFTDFC